MKTIQHVYTRRNRGPWSIPAPLAANIGHRERAVLESRTCEAFPHRLNRDCDFYLSDDCTTYYCPEAGQFTVRGNVIVN